MGELLILTGPVCGSCTDRKARRSTGPFDHRRIGAEDASGQRQFQRGSTGRLPPHRHARDADSAFAGYLLLFLAVVVVLFIVLWIGQFAWSFL